jgi:hypothetical protein
MPRGTIVELARRMENLLVTCPETGRREEISGIISRDGEMLVVLRCSRFDSNEPISCTADCVHCPTQVSAACDRWRIPTAAAE